MRWILIVDHEYRSEVFSSTRAGDGVGSLGAGNEAAVLRAQ